MKTTARLFLLLSVMASPLMGQRLIEQSIFTDTLCVGKGCGQSFCALPAYDTSKELLICDETEIAGWINGTEGLYLYSSSPTVTAIIETASASGIPVLRFINGQPQIWNLGMDPTEKFRLGDGTALTNPVTVEAGSPDDSIYVDSTGAIGFGTATPTHQIDVYSATDPTVYMNVESGAVNSAAATIYTTDDGTWLAGPYAGSDIFGVYDNTNAKAPFTIERSAASDSLYIDSTGDIGLGTASPASDLHISDTAGNAEIQIDTLSQSWKFRNLSAGGDLVLIDNTGSKTPFRVVPNTSTNVFGLGVNTAGGAAVTTIALGRDAGPTVTVDIQGDILLNGELVMAEISAPTATASSGTLWTESDDELHWFDGSGVEHILTPAYGEISAEDNATETTISTIGASVQVTIFDTNGISRGVTPDHTNDHLVVGAAGDYEIVSTWTINSVSGGGASRADLEIKKNNGASRVGSCHQNRTMAGGGGESGAVTVACTATLAASDTIEAWIANETNTSNYTVEDITLYLKRLDM